nr:protoheme IX farnesyltransferase [uncultured Desulfobulbus sp.]
MKKRAEKIRAFVQVSKAVLCLPIGCSAGFGFILYQAGLSWSLLAVSLGVFLLACGGAAGNSLQEIEIDRLYERTCRRPLVTGQLSPLEGGSFCLVSCLLGMLLLGWGTTDWLPVALGLIALVFYNGVYTRLKRRSPYALLPGAVAGALPPVIGWCGAGGPCLSHPSWLLFSLYFVWQIPHFFLVYFRHQHDYQRVGKPVLMVKLSPGGAKRLFMVWLLACMTIISAAPLYLPQLQLPSKMILLGLCCFLGCFAVFIWREEEGGEQMQRGFIVFNGGFILSICLVSLVQLY